MKLCRAALLLVMCSVGMQAHPMGNFSINHYLKIRPQPQAVELFYILDFAEIPTSQLLANGSVGKQQAAEWARGLQVKLNGAATPVLWNSVSTSTSDGAGGLPVLRVEMRASLMGDGAKDRLTVQDSNFANRTGWKEIVVERGKGVIVDESSPLKADISHELTVYPVDLTVTPPQDLQASVSWHSRAAGKIAAPVERVEPVKPAPPPPTFTAPAGAGAVERGDYLSNLLKSKHFGVSAILFGLLAAFGLGAVHALSPGHGKTIVAAYLVGSRGTLKHAGILGLVVTFTHTISVFLLGIGVLFFQRYVIPEKIVPVLGAISGLSIVAIGAYLLYQRTSALLLDGNVGHGHAHSHGHSHGRAHSHSHSHSHALPERVTMASLMGLGISGGLVPCPSALVLLLASISVGQVAFGLALLGAFSAGLAIVLMSIGGMVLYGKRLLPRSSASQHPLVRLLPVFSSVVVIVLGLLMTLAATGVIQPVKLFI